MNIEEYDRMFQHEEKYWWYIARRALVSKLIKKFSKAKRIFDAGCGTGMNMIEFSKYGSIRGCDFSRRAIKFCKIRGIKTAFLADAAKVNMGKPDTILALDLIEHCEDDNKTIENFYKNLENGGILIITTPAIKFMFGKHDTALKHFRRYTKKELELKLKKAGFKIEKITYWNFVAFFPGFIYGRLMKYSKSRSKSYTTPYFLNRYLLTLIKLENRIVENIGNPFMGLSLICVARK